MRKITCRDVKDIIEYEKIRPQFRARVIELKKARRVSVGRLVTFVFENRDTVLFQIEEMMRAERIVREDDIAHEVAIYNALLPDENELSATMLIEITDKRRIKATLDRFMGIDQGRKVWLEFGGERIHGQFEQGRSSEEKISAVHFVRFKFTPAQARRFRSREDAVTLAIAQPAYRRKALLPGDVVKSLASDFES